MPDFPFKIGGVALDGKSTMPALKYQGATFSLESIDSSNTGRNQQGKMIRDMITEKIKWSLEFAPCNSSQLSALISAVSGTSHSSFSFTYPDPRTGSTNTGYFYVGARSAPVWKVSRANGNVGLWGNVTMDFIEM